MRGGLPTRVARSLAAIPSGDVPLMQAEGVYAGQPGLWMSAVAAANFIVTADPSVAPGRAAPVGSLARTADGAQAWTKYGPADTAWRSLNETRASVTAAGGPLASLDLTIVVPAASGVTVKILAKRDLNVSQLYLRINGAPVVYGGGMVSSQSLGTIDWLGHAGYAGVSAYTQTVFQIWPAVDGGRHMRGTADYPAQAGYAENMAGRIVAGAISSVGVEVRDGNHLANGSRVVAAVADCWVAL